MPTCRIHWVSSFLSIGFGILLSWASPLHAQDVASITQQEERHSENLPGVMRLPPLPGELESPVISSLALSPNGKWVAVAGDDHAIRLLSLQCDGIRHVLIGHRDWVKGLAFSPGGNLLASCGHDGSLRVWNISNSDGSVKEWVERHVDHALFTVAFGSDTEVYSAGFSGSIYRLDLAKEQFEVDLQCDCRDIRSLDCSRDGRWLVFGGRDGILRLASLQREEHRLAATTPPTRQGLVTTPSLHFARIQAVRFSEDGKSVFSVGEDRRLVQWDVASQSVVGQMDIKAGKLLTVCPIKDDLVAVSGSDNTIRIVDVKRSTVVSKLVGHDGSIATLQCNATHLVSGGFDTTLRSWDIEQSLRQIDDAGRFVHPIASQFEDSSSHERIR